MWAPELAEADGTVGEIGECGAEKGERSARPKADADEERVGHQLDEDRKQAWPKHIGLGFAVAYARRQRRRVERENGGAKPNDQIDGAVGDHRLRRAAVLGGEGPDMLNKGLQRGGDRQLHDVATCRRLRVARAHLPLTQHRLSSPRPLAR